MTSDKNNSQQPKALVQGKGTSQKTSNSEELESSLSADKIFSLSDKRSDRNCEGAFEYKEDYVREFIRLLKERLIEKDYYTLANEIIDELAGKELI